MRENNLRKIWSDGGAVVNGWLGIPSGLSAEVMAHQGWDSLTVDMQHGVVDYQMAASMFQAISTTDTVPMARVPWLEPGIIMKALDAGAYGIICPMVSNRAEAERFVGACRYPPQGYRSFGPVRALMYGGADYPQHANDTVLAIAMIETEEAMENLDEIMSVPGLDGVYIGPADLSIAHGRPPKFDHTEPEMMAVIERILATAKSNGIAAGIHCGSTAYARRMIGLGFQLVTILGDYRLLAGAASQAVREVREGGATESAGSASAY